jgi:hypothetical protein
VPVAGLIRPEIFPVVSCCFHSYSRRQTAKSSVKAGKVISLQVLPTSKYLKEVRKRVQDFVGATEVVLRPQEFGLDMLAYLRLKPNGLQKPAEVMKL